MNIKDIDRRTLISIKLEVQEVPSISVMLILHIKLFGTQFNLIYKQDF